MNRYTLGWLALSVSFCVPAGAQMQQTHSATSANTIKAAAQHAIATNPEVQAAWHAYLAAEHAKDVARGGFFPRVDLEASIGREDQEIKNQNAELEFDRRRARLSLNQLLYDGFGTASEVRRLDHNLHARRFDLHGAAQSAALEAYRAYQDVNRFRQLVSLAQQNLSYHQEIYRQINERTSAGISRNVDLEQAVGRMSLAESNLITEVSNLHDVSARFQRIIGQIPNDQLNPAPMLLAGMPSQILQGLQVAYAHNPTILSAVQGIRATQASVRGAKSRYHPRLDLRAYSEYGEDIDRIVGRTDDQVIELVLSFNLFNGGADQAAVRQAADEMGQAQDLRDKACRDVRQTLRIAYNDTQRIAQQITFLEKHKLSIESARVAYRDQFSIGQRTLLDLLDTENEYFEANRAYVNGLYDQSIAHARTLASMGQLLVALGVSRQGLSDVARDDVDDGRGALCPMDERADLIANTWADSDGDGVPDPRDACPGTPPGVPVDERGCELIGDDDKDGVLNNMDLCPNTPLGVAVNEVGCALKQHVVLHGVDFKVYSAELTAAAKRNLDDVAQTILGSRSMRLEVAGHTDSSGSASLNRRLSQQRAESVVRYLVSRGVDESRLEPRGYGPTQPLVSNETARGRERNRRVEFRVLSQ